VEPQYSPNGDGKCAGPDVLNEVYTALIKRSRLNSEHRKALESRGFNPDLAVELGYRSLGSDRIDVVRHLIGDGLEKHFSSVPGFTQQVGRSGKPYWSLAGWGGLLIPVRDHQHRVVALRIRLDPGRDNIDSGKYRMLSSKKSKPPGPGPGTPSH